MSIEIVEGWTGPLVYVLKADGVAQNLQGMTVTMIARNAHGDLLSLAGTLSVTDPASGQVTFNPSANDIKLGVNPMEIRFKVVDATSKIVYFPNGDPETWRIRI